MILPMAMLRLSAGRSCFSSKDSVPVFVLPGLALPSTRAALCPFPGDLRLSMIVRCRNERLPEPWATEANEIQSHGSLLLFFTGVLQWRLLHERERNRTNVKAQGSN